MPSTVSWPDPASVEASSTSAPPENSTTATSAASPSMSSSAASTIAMHITDPTHATNPCWKAFLATFLRCFFGDFLRYGFGCLRCGRSGLADQIFASLLAEGVACALGSVLDATHFGFGAAGFLMRHLRFGGRPAGHARP